MGRRRGKGDIVDVPFELGPERVKTSIKIDPLVWREFQVACRRVRQSTCGVLEPFIYAFSRSVSAGDYHDPRPMTVNLHMERVVQRYRRKGHEVEIVQEQEIQGDRGHCAWCGEKPDVETWIRHSPYVMKRPYLCTRCLAYIIGRGVRVTYREL